MSSATLVVTGFFLVNVKRGLRRTTQVVEDPLPQKRIVAKEGWMRWTHHPQCKLRVRRSASMRYRLSLTLHKAAIRVHFFQEPHPWLSSLKVPRLGLWNNSEPVVSWSHIHPSWGWGWMCLKTVWSSISEMGKHLRCGNYARKVLRALTGNFPL